MRGLGGFPFEWEWFSNKHVSSKDAQKDSKFAGPVWVELLFFLRVKIYLGGDWRSHMHLPKEKLTLKVLEPFDLRFELIGRHVDKLGQGAVTTAEVPLSKALNPSTFPGGQLVD